MDVYKTIASRRTIRDFADKLVPMEITEKIISAGLMAPTNDHMRNWEFVVVNDKNARADLLQIAPMNKKDAIDNLLDSWEMRDERQRRMYHDAIPKQFSMLYTAGCLIIPLFKMKGKLLKPDSLSSLNPFASIWCCIENMLLAAASEGIFGVTRIPMKEESEHIRQTIGHPDEYMMPCYVALGYPSEKSVRAAQRDISIKDKIHINTWEKA